ncbi:c-type cytochrome [Ideonella paludis]|uniref:C-type cytochrome n=1 Tax=Ideonella paludis TaxID=1233411 RepID=A0ABS5E2N7_9BURK|nr:c-type cytochrome [Ideonella paludis]MBQ0937574.1 c-type cytochrome [Ideonella paludis]
MQRWWAVGLLVWAVASTAAEPTAPLRVPDTLAQRALACTGCHGPQGRSSPQGYVPRIAGKPEAYLYQQLLAFREGRRPHEAMARLLTPLTDDYLRTLAGHFASLEVAYLPVAQRPATPAALQTGQRLVQQGDPSRQLPACVACHGSALMGVAPAIPGLLGLPQDYVVGQLGAWRAGTRRAREPDCMAHIVRPLQTEEIAAIAAWLTAQPVPVSAKPAASLPAPLPQRCGSTELK